MKFIRFFIYLLILFFYTNIHALEITFTGVDCNQLNSPAVQSKIIVSNQVGNYYTVTVSGGLPSYDNTNFSCLDIMLRQNGDGPALPPPSSIQGTAIYSAPFLYVFVNGVKSNAPKSNYSTTNVFTFTIGAKNSFVLMREDWLGSYQGVNQSGSTLYNQPGQSVIYGLSLSSN